MVAQPPVTQPESAAAPAMSPGNRQRLLPGAPPASGAATGLLWGSKSDDYWTCAINQWLANGSQRAFLGESIEILEVFTTYYL